LFTSPELWLDNEAILLMQVRSQSIWRPDRSDARRIFQLEKSGSFVVADEQSVKSESITWNIGRFSKDHRSEINNYSFWYCKSGLIDTKRSTHGRVMSTRQLRAVISVREQNEAATRL
jgi:hypothetical protein